MGNPATYAGIQEATQAETQAEGVKGGQKGPKVG
jgi:hypothetical protein